MLKSTLKIIFNNYYLIFGVIVGLFLNFSLIELDCTQKATFVPDFNYSTLKTVLRNNRTRGGAATSRTAPVRPRYYSTELGIREQLFIGVFTAEERLQAQTVHVNRTLRHLVPQVRFFLTAPAGRRRSNAVNSLNYSGLIGFTEGRPTHRPFQAIKYIGDNFLQDYDYYFLMNDYDYLDVRKLQQFVAKISVSSDVYAGSVVNDGSYCNLDAGVLLSNSVLKAMKDHVEWCVMNAVTSDNSENLGRCVYYAAKLECQAHVNGISLPSYKLRSFDLEKKFKQLRDTPDFNSAVTVYPIVNKADFYLLHSHFSQLHLQRLRTEIAELSVDLTEHWPPGERKGSVPATRFDLPLRVYFNRTHVFAPDDFTTIRRHKRAEQLDIDYILQRIVENTNANLEEKVDLLEVVNGYRTFDMSRGLDYVFDLKFEDKRTKKVINKRFEVCKPIGTAEFIQAPYVTENSKVTILLPIEEHEVDTAAEFLQRFDANILAKREKVLLMLVFLYQYDTPSKGGADVFSHIKDGAIRASNKYKSEDTKVAWVSIRLPQLASSNEGDKLVKSDYNVLNFVAVDLALKKVGVDSLILVATPTSDMHVEFLNRVRMNTVLNFQIFSAIPFRFYHPQIAVYDDNSPEINKNNGHFDAESYDFISFYGKDYVAARKRAKHLVPLTRVDNDIANVLDDVYRNRGNLFAMFVEFARDLHCLRAPDMSLMMKYHDEMTPARRHWFLGTKTQLAKVILANSEV